MWKIDIDGSSTDVLAFKYARPMSISMISVWRSLSKSQQGCGITLDPRLTPGNFVMTMLRNIRIGSRGVVGAKMADAFLKEYRFSNDERQHAVHLVRHHLVCYSSEWSDAAVRRFVKRVGLGEVDPLLRLARADALGKGRPVDEEMATLAELRARVDKLMEAGAALSTGDLAVNGRDVLERLDGRGGPVVGEILRELLENVLEDPSVNERSEMLAQLDAVVARRRAEGGA